MRYAPSDTLPNLPYFLMKNEGWDVVEIADGWQIKPLRAIELARIAGLDVDSEGYLLK